MLGGGGHKVLRLAAVIRLSFTKADFRVRLCGRTSFLVGHLLSAEAGSTLMPLGGRCLDSRLTSYISAVGRWPTGGSRLVLSRFTGGAQAADQ